MLSIYGKPRSACDGLSRRTILSAGGAGLFGLSLPKLFAAEQQSATRRPAKAKSVIFLFLFGGPSQFETFDMKPDAPAEIRGPFQPTASRTPGLLISEHLEKLAAISNKYCVIRSMTHTYNDHSGAAHYLQTGHRWQVPVGGGFSSTPNDWPSMGSVVEYVAEHADGGLQRELPSYAVVPNWLGRLQDRGQYRRPGQYGGWLGLPYNGLITSVAKQSEKDNPYWRNCSDDELTYLPEGLSPEISLDTIRRRKSLLDQFESARANVERIGPAQDRFRERAMSLLASEKTRAALDIRREDDKLRDQYGRHLFGQSCLLARRMVEAGVRFVTVHYDCVDGYGWDSHKSSDDVKSHLLPTFDQACSALLTDLDQRGLLEETLVVALGEMGRTPKPTPTWGRGHWSTLFPALIAGAGVAGGTTYGRSDSGGANVVENPVSPEDLAATIYTALGIDPNMMLHDALNRPIPLVDGGRAVKGIFG